MIYKFRFVKLEFDPPPLPQPSVYFPENKENTISNTSLVRSWLPNKMVDIYGCTPASSLFPSALMNSMYFCLDLEDHQSSCYTTD